MKVAPIALLLLLGCMMHRAEGLKCYKCNSFQGSSRCFNTETCRSDQTQCIRMLFTKVSYGYAKRCSTEKTCRELQLFGPSAGIQSHCCGYDLCN
ncbi:CD59B glycoprotein-like [Latimeria chalumnae]|uniref:CD59B glycoprotein-like n=1 Tax=Latimeria chalumnae TaxID=7897 RepID=UPI0003C161CB